MLNQIFIPLMAAFLIVAVMGPFAIPMLLRLKIGNTEREELKSHQVKNGTPSMGGIMILIALTVVSIVYGRSYPRILPVLELTLGFGIIGFIDDFLKTIKKNSDGLIAWQKLLLEILVTGIFLYLLLVFYPDFRDLIIPFCPERVNSGVWSYPLVFFVVLGTVNGVNFTDGLDGLASSVTAVVAAFFGFASLYLGLGLEPIAAAVIGALMGFLLYNLYPARVFMGDTGSLALGGFVAGAAYMLHMPIFIPIVGGIYLIEVLSVIIQVGYFKATHGKRVFRMAPIHHHFELGGWSETRVVGIFTIATVILSLIAMLGLLGGV